MSEQEKGAFLVGRPSFCLVLYCLVRLAKRQQNLHGSGMIVLIEGLEGKKGPGFLP